MSKNEKAIRQARAACWFFGGFTTAATVLAALHQDVKGCATCLLITLIIFVGKDVLLDD